MMSLVTVSSSEYSYSSGSDDNYDNVEDVCISEMFWFPCWNIRQLPGLPIVIKHKGYLLVGDYID